ncbi:hypothetical protein MMC30_002155 [Trapelia coarctata]|nr:hypothetical protein [Trapelia coarctata]
MNTQRQGASTSATLRPRNRRLISIDDEFETVDSGSPSGTGFQNSATSTFLSSRTVSPLPSTHPSRSTSRARTPEAAQWSSKSLRGFGFGGSQTSLSTPTTGLWESSWASLQGIASAILGSDVKDPSKDKPLSSRPPRKRRPLDYTISWKSANTSPEQWGPSVNAERHVAAGSQEDRLAQLQAKKRETLLTANGHAFPDSTGKFKRRGSEDRECVSAPPPEDHERDALVYLHHVQPNDTLAGVAIKYNCPIAVFRKANRLWPNDRIQIRDVVYLPVDACGVKGRKIPEPAATSDLFVGDSNEDSTPTPTNAYHDFRSHPDPKSSQLSSITTSPSTSTSNPNPQDPPWKHDSWVVIDPFPVAVEIARLSRRTLGFFPPSRRKSVGYSDLETPSLSFDLARPRDTQPSPGPHTSPGRFTSPARRTGKSRSSSGSYFPSMLSGPGGVGTLGHEATSPGPAQDKLNQLFAPHLPNVAPRTSFESVASTSSTGIENVGGAIEGWMRKMATKAAAAVQTPPLRGRNGAGGDLIELVEGWELDGGSANADGDGDTITEERVGRARGSEREEEERMLRERFPVRGRVFEDRGKKKGV